MERRYTRLLKCGCQISSDFGGRVMPCSAEFRDMKSFDDIKMLELHNQEWKRWMNSKDYQKHLKELNKNKKTQ